ncbi:hypothetical protein Q9L58_010224 [Maublancomyces gigas]|uniref:Ubiquitin-like domain-containing protein n=1 Tax=Discina gigas TaxID=1032678 RepID=A0ABR3G4N4_9PEZI
MSFGFGFSDIVLVSNGAIKFWTTIHNAPTEQAELAKTHRLLQEVVQRITDYGSVLAPKLSPTTAIALEQQLSLCAKHLHSLEQIATKYMGHSLTAPGLQSKSQRHRLARWGLYKRDEFVQSLEELRKVVVLLLSYAMFENTLLASLGTPPDCEPLRLMDALNRETVCSISMCDTWEGFEDFLKFTFKRSAGKAWVKAGKYQITNDSNGGILTAQQWEANIKAGLTVSMAMVLRKREAIEENAGNNCPSCATPYMGIESIVVEGVRCKKCATFFQVSSETRVTELLDNVVGHGHGNGSVDKLTQPNEAVDMDDIKYFRRMHVIMDRFKPTILPSDDAHSSDEDSDEESDTEYETDDEIAFLKQYGTDDENALHQPRYECVLPDGMMGR